MPLVASALPVDDPGVPVRWSRSRTSADPPAGTVNTYQAAAFVPVRLELTVAAPLTTWSLMPSFGYGVVAGSP